MTLTPEGLRRGRKIVAAGNEAEIYEALGLQYIEPELREGLDEIERAAAHKIPPLVTATELLGVLHAHTTASDGADTLEAMAEASLANGYQYIGITDHSKTAHYAGGLTIEEIEQQQAEIDHLNAAFGDRFRIFKGIESDILPDGSLDYPVDVLRRFDFIIGSIHGQFRLDRQAQTERLVRAASNPFITVIGHMTGRQLLRRPGYDLDIERVLGACAEHDVAVEVNGNPWRLDLDWRWLRRGIELAASSALTPMPIRRARSLPRRAGVWRSPGKAACLPTGSSTPSTWTRSRAGYRRARSGRRPSVSAKPQQPRRRCGV